ncbi:metal ABC transporter permease [Truepera radiovictrix]|uniref:ABC-3 protein n=1 Tax=Truepera radiovictrix (strain DSM 17093 / CIP 108686 / LMG 22925 / RQ-24) TaxID=649638 RepID=D7CU95_TRURR|nr:metal ABC transporter permease [Truepera radiovictrix]ADI13993.1 ABC-3 protein [Truepera radiovictrix DSM 17093]WMT57447.1 metal ABC transporter permease [Truepera radiovictrix]
MSVSATLTGGLDRGATTTPQASKPNASVHLEETDMLAELIDVFQLPFMQRALLAGLLVALMCGVLGVFVVQRGLSFLGDGLAHAAFGGVALGLLLGVEQPLWVALAFTLVASLGIAWVRDHTRLSSDTAIGIFFAVSVALGVMFISFETQFNVDAWHLLFGSILGIGQQELRLIAGLAPLSLGLLALLWSHLAYATFDAELAQTDGVRVRGLEYLLFALAAVVIVASVRVVGAILIAAYLVIPAASARLVTRSLFSMTLLSALLGVFSTAFGLGASYVLEVPSGSTIILTQALLFLAAALASRR